MATDQKAKEVETMAPHDSQR
eukprot:SAG31_NODE_22127_length_533_cov_0.880184_1_plen_20_part_10